MPVITQSACGKAILLGEHAVVHSQPAIAIPLSSKRITVRVEAQIVSPTGKIWVNSPVLGLNQDLGSLPEYHPLFQAVRLTLAELGVIQGPSCTLHISSTLPISSGLGSSASLAVATIRALSEFLGHPLDLDTVNRIAFECETYVHGKPSGIDNTVVTYEKPIFFQKDRGAEIIQPGKQFTFVLADSGVSKSTHQTVAGLARDLTDDFETIQPKLEQIGLLVIQGKQALLQGNTDSLADAINRNQALLSDLNLSCPELDLLIREAMRAGALAAKLTGGGRGGHMLALVDDDKIEPVLEALQKVPGSNPFFTIVKPGAEA